MDAKIALDATLQFARFFSFAAQYSHPLNIDRPDIYQHADKANADKVNADKVRE